MTNPQDKRHIARKKMNQQSMKKDTKTEPDNEREKKGRKKKRNKERIGKDTMQSAPIHLTH